MTRRSSHFFLIGVLMIAFAVQVGLSQSHATDAQIEGFLTDSNGAAIPSAVVTAININTGAKTTAVSGADGYYQFPILSLGKYNIIVEHPGFKRFERHGVDLFAGQTATVSIVLEPGTVNETVTVNSDAAIADASRLEIGRQINTRDVKELPLVSRNPLNYVLLEPGVTGRPQSGPVVVGLSSNGLSRRAAYGIDGGFNNDAGSAGFRLNIISEVFVKEMQVLSSSYPAEFGNTAGVIVNVVTPSGTNDFHGDASIFWRPSELSSKPFGFQRGGSDPNIDGYGITASVGGPIIENRWHFFGGFEWTLRKTLPVITISDANKQALIESGLPATIFTDDKGVYDPFPYFIVRSDAQVSHNTRLSARYNRFTVGTRNFGTGGINTNERSTDLFGWDHAIGLQAVTAFSQTFFNEFRFQSAKRIAGNRPNDRSGTGVGVLIPNIAAFGSPVGGVATTVNQSQLQFQDNVTKSFDRHLVKVGAAINYIRDTSQLLTTAQYTFANVADYRNAVNGTNSRGYLSYQQTFGSSRNPLNSYYLNLFVQDSFAATERFRISAGLRYDLYVSPEANRDSPLPFSKKFSTDTNNISPRLAASYSIRDGRYSIVIRGGSGFYYDPPLLTFYKRATQNNGNPEFFSFTFQNGSSTGPDFPNTLPNFPPGTVIPPRDVDAIAPDFKTMYAVHTNFQIEQAISENASLTAGFLYSIARHIPVYRNINCIPTGETLADGRPLYGTATVKPNGNVAITEPCKNRVFPEFNSILMVESGGNLNYRGMFLQLYKRFSSGYQLWASYTFSKAVDDAAEILGGTSRNSSDPSNRETDKGSASGDVRHVFRLSTVARPRFNIANRFVSAVANNNQIGVIVYADSGENQNIVTNFDLNRDGVFGAAGPDRPVGVPRNALRLPAYFNADLKYSRSIPLGENKTVEVFFEASNVFNIKAVSTYNVVLTGNNVNTQVDPLTGLLHGTLPDFGDRVASWRPSRQLQIGVKFSF